MTISLRAASRRLIRGVSILELLAAVAIMGLIAPLIHRAFKLYIDGLTSHQARNFLNTESQRALNSVSKSITESKRILQSPEADTLISYVHAYLPPNPAPIAGTRLPIITLEGSLSPSTPTFVGSNMGNSLFFARNKGTLDLVVGVSTEIASIDVYQFHYIYVGMEEGTIAGQQKRGLWEFQSYDYADVLQIRNITDPLKQVEAITQLMVKGVYYAWDPSLANDPDEFFDLTSYDITTQVDFHPMVYSVKPLIEFMASAVPGGYKYGVSPNNPSNEIPIKQRVPMAATSWMPAGSPSPSGFESMIVGQNGGRQVFLRLVMVAQGSFASIASHEQIVLTTARDLW